MRAKAALLFLSLVTLSLALAVSAQVECPNAPSKPQDRRTNTSRLVISTFNAEWLFLDGKNCPGSGCPWANEAAALQHLADVAAVVKGVDADIITIEEVQGCDVLRALIDLLPSDFGYKPYLVKGTDTSTGQNVGLLTRIDPSIDLQRTEQRASFPISGTDCGPTTAGTSGISKHYYTIINVNGIRILFVGMHLIAFPIDPSRCNQREAQATVARSLITSLEGEFDELVILGDLNDYSGTVIDAAGDKPTSRVLEWFGSIPSVDIDMTNVAQYLTQPNRYTAWYDIDNSCSDQGGKEHTSIDHLLISPGLNAKRTSSSIDHSYTVSCKTKVSDHWPVIVELAV